jgi:DNA-binding MarR family transcriptional regulator
MTSPSPTEGRDVRWLDLDERAAWLALVRFMTKLPPALDAQLERDSGLNYFEYIVMAMLSEAPGRTLGMSQLASLTNASLSRLSHVAKRLEKIGLVRREPDELDGRTTNATLTDHGMGAVVAAAPGHVTAVRELVFDALSSTQVKQLHAALEGVLKRVDPGGRSDPFAAPTGS